MHVTELSPLWVGINGGIVTIGAEIMSSFSLKGMKIHLYNLDATIDTYPQGQVSKKYANTESC